jgi:disulfide bond formation protein DsbB
VQWVFLGLTIPGWTLVIFTAFTISGLLLIATRIAMPPAVVSSDL